MAGLAAGGLLVLAAALGPGPARAETTPNVADEGATALARGSASEAVTSFTAALADTGLANDRRAALLNDRAVAYMRLGQVKLALEDFNRAAQLFPEYAAIYNNRGNLLLSIGLTKEALKDFDRAIVLAPGYAAAYNNRAGAYVKLGQYADAIRDFTQAIQLLPSNPAPLTGRGKAQLALNRPHAAIRDFSRAVTADARFATGYRSRAEAKLEVEHYDEAIEDLSRAVAFDVNNAEIYAVRGMAYLEMRNVEAALKDFSQAITLDPKLVRAYEGRGLAHALAEATDEAFADLNKAIELDPRSARAFAFRAFLYKQSGQVDIAQKDVETAQKLGADKPEVLWAAAEIAEAQGAIDLAIANLKKALALRPGYKDASDSLMRLTGGVADFSDTLVEGAGIEKWRVVLRANRYYAVNDEMPRLSVPLEMMGEGKPRLVSWEVQPPPVKGIGVLKFYGGVVTTRTGSEESELAALVDIDEAKIIAIAPNRQGSKSATWTWEEGRVIVASVDGVTEEFPLRTLKPADNLAASGARRYSGSGQTATGWSPWNEPWAGGFGGGQRPQRSAGQTKKKPKTLFDLLFN